MEETVNLFKEALETYEPAQLIGLAAGIMVFILELVLTSKGILFSSGDKRLKKAAAEGRVLTGYQVSLNFRDRTKDSGVTDRIWTASYEYMFQGRKGRKVLVSTNSRPAPTITLYHDGSKVYTDNEMRKHNRIILIFIIPFAVMIAVALLLGYRP